MVPESHELLFHSSDELRDFFKSSDFRDNVCTKLKEQYEVDTSVETSVDQPTTQEEGSNSPTPPEDRVMLGYTRNNAGGLKDAIDFLISRLVAHGLDATTVKGAIPRQVRLVRRVAALFRLETAPARTCSSRDRFPDSAEFL